MTSGPVGLIHSFGISFQMIYRLRAKVLMLILMLFQTGCFVLEFGALTEKKQTCPGSIQLGLYHNVQNVKKWILVSVWGGREKLNHEQTVDTFCNPSLSNFNTCMWLSVKDRRSATFGGRSGCVVIHK